MFLQHQEELYEQVREAGKKIRWFGIVMAILMIIVGVVLFFVPTTSATLTIWLLIAGVLLFGISDIVSFCRMPKGARDGFQLALGIIWILIALFAASNCLFSTIADKILIWGSFETILGLVIGFNCVFSAIDSFAMAGDMRALGGSSSFCVFGGILGLLAGIIILCNPVISALAITIFYGAFLLVGGISLLCRVLSYK